MPAPSEDKNQHSSIHDVTSSGVKVEDNQGQTPVSTTSGMLSPDIISYILYLVMS